jgi:hypothetical protein
VIRPAYGRQEGEEIRLFAIEDGEPIENGSPTDGILMSRLDVDVQVLDIPSIPEKEVEGLIRYPLRSIYPGNPNLTIFDYRLQNIGKDHRAVVFISQRSTLEKYRARADKIPLFLPYCFYERLAKKRGDLRVWFCFRDWIELTVFKAGSVASSIVLRRDNGEPFDILFAESELSEEVRELPVLCVASDEETERFRQDLQMDAPDVFSFMSFRELFAQSGKTAGLFNPPRQQPKFLTPAIRLISLAAAVLVISILVFFKYVASVERGYEQLKSQYAALEMANRNTIAIQSEADALKVELSKLQAEKPQDLYPLLSELFSVLGTDAKVQSIAFQNDQFQIKAVGANSLKLMEELKRRPSFGSVNLSQAVADPRTGKETFSFSGAYHAR